VPGISTQGISTQGPGVEIDSAVVAVLLGVESHARPPFEVVSSTQQRTAWVALEGGLKHGQPPAEDRWRGL
jgi:hypothetical protein